MEQIIGIAIIVGIPIFVTAIYCMFILSGMVDEAEQSGE